MLKYIFRYLLGPSTSFRHDRGNNALFSRDDFVCVGYREVTVQLYDYNLITPKQNIMD
jgi:hypothetical protein